MQPMLDEIRKFAGTNEMVINSSKTKLMVFNKSQKYDFMPEFSISANNEPIEVVEQMKLLGLTIDSDLTWHSQVKNMCRKAYCRIWMISRLKKLGASDKMLIDLYQKHVRSVVEYATPVWNSGLTQSDINEIERIQKTALSVIFNENSYTKKLEMSNLEKLRERRDVMCQKFAIKTVKNPRFADWFVKKQNPKKYKTEKHVL